MAEEYTVTEEYRLQMAEGRASALPFRSKEEKMSYPEKLTSGYYRVKVAWEDKKTIGQFRLLGKAKEEADKNPGSFVFDPEGAVVYPVKEVAAEDEGTITEDEAVAEESVDTAEAADTMDDKDSVADTEAEPVEDEHTQEKPGETAPVAYCKLKTLMNIRKEPKRTADKVTVYRKHVICEVLEVCENEWLKIVCPEAETGVAYVCNEDGAYAWLGKSLYKTALGDSLSGIAAKRLGNAGLSMQIKVINGMTSNTLLPNTVLLLP